ncbi:MAG TPA: ABC transporter permease, partial [Rugosimonospora sp.]|nr:ABC transporter permease [Rugosimonospora sp.]
MVRLAWRMLTQRPASMLATLVALWFAVLVVTACGAMLESGVRYHGTPQRYAAAPILVASTELRLTEGSGEDSEVESEPLAVPGRVDSALVATIAALPGVRAVVADQGVPAQV